MKEEEQCEAAIKGETERVTALIDSCADVTYFDSDGLTPLMHAAKHNHAPVLDIRLTVGAPWDSLSPSNLSAPVISQCKKGTKKPTTTSFSSTS
ncbi:arginine N-methyltransferase 2-like, partial [Trifolium medium]|nr:arginine N-methyltransferase 2-like [Trifolium medium]